MILLNGHSLAIKNRFQVESMQMTLMERQSTASFTVGPDAPTLAVGDWLKDDEEPGKGIIWRVKTVDTQYDTNTRTITLEHIINTLKDQVMFGEVKPKDMSGVNNATTCTARQAAQYIINRQSDWVLGEFQYSVSNPYNFNSEDLFSALETVSSSLIDSWWSYDLSVYPFRLNICYRSNTVKSEMRMSRNIQTAKKTIDRTRMYTRHYPIGKNNLHISGNYISKNENLYGVVCKVETDSSKETEAELLAWSQERLARHCEPGVTVTVNALDLSAETGEPLDNIVLGALCQMPLPEYNTTIKEFVTKLNWSDKVREPEKITVTLANTLEDVASIVNSLSKSSSGGAKAAAKKGEEDHAWFLDTTTHVGMVAEAVAGPGAATDWSRVSSVIVDGQGIHQRVVLTEEGLVSAWSAIEATESKIYLEVANAKSDTYSKIEITASSIRSEVNSSKSTIFSTIMQTATNIYTQVGNAKSDTYSKIEQTASSIRSEVNSSKSTIYSTIMQTATNIYSEVANAKSGLYSSIEQTQSSISLKVGKGEVVSCINQTAETIKISASKIQLDGTTIANLIKTTEVQVASLEVTNGCDLNSVDCGYIDCTGIGTNTGDVTCGGTVDTDGLKVANYSVSWKSQSVITDMSTSGNYGYWAKVGSSGSTTVTGSSAYQKMITDITLTTKTLHYLGR